MANDRKVFRRQKTCPNRDAMHTIRVGIVIFIVLLLLLPPLLP
jgi:hypothetical protein